MKSSKILLIQSSTFIIILFLKLSLPLLVSSCGLKEKISPLVDKSESTADDNKKNSSVKIDTLMYYYPVSLIDDNKNVMLCDTFKLSTYSGSLLKAREPVIYSFSGYDVYRMLTLGKNGCIIISLIKNNEKVWIDVKQLNRPAFLKPQPSGRFVPSLNSDGSIDTTMPVSYEEHQGMVESLYDIKMTSFTYEYSADTWNNFEYLIDAAGFRKMQPCIRGKTKGNENRVIESRVNNKYWLVERWDPEGEFKKCCDYLLELKSIAEKNPDPDNDWDD